MSELDRILKTVQSIIKPGFGKSKLKLNPLWAILLNLYRRYPVIIIKETLSKCELLSSMIAILLSADRHHLGDSGLLHPVSGAVPGLEGQP